jgi:transglutaminase-like putative cysteine protease
VNLTEFDGRRWLEDVRSAGTSADVAGIADRRWVQSIDVTIRALRSAEFVTAGTTLAIADAQRATVRSAPGVVEATGKPLSRGESYRALVYVPQPTARQMRSAGTRYPTSLHADYGFLRLPATRPGFGTDDVTVPIPFWGGPAQALQPDIAATFAGSRYAGVYALAQRLKAGASTPYAYMRAIERYLATGFAYSETPPPSRAPLADFLLRDKLGYCQQFSGAMALLLRMGGIPARVSAGFAPGVRDERTKEWVVRDVDAHSWVEVYFPGIGWVTRDPTPAASPARSQTADLAPAAGDASVAIGGGAGSAPLGGNLANRGDAASPAATASDTRSSHTLLYLGGGALVLLAALLAVVLRRRRRGDGGGEQDELAELRRALRRSGRPPEPQLTLASLAHRLDGTPAEGYVRTLAAARYGYAAARPSRDQRAALRRELAAGLGLRGRLRAWWALPPRLIGVRSRTT